MFLKIIQNFYAPKQFTDEDFADDINSHMIVFKGCNFKCQYCDFWSNPDVGFKKISYTDYKNTIRYLIQKGKRFKFTGGEPTLNSRLIDLLGEVKSRAGIVYLDSNGSMPEKISTLIENKLIDVLGISLKGLSPEEAICNSGIKSIDMVWYNPQKTIKNALKKNRNVVVLVTKVFYDYFSQKQIEKFADILSPFGNRVYLKINNLLQNRRNLHLRPIPINQILQETKKFISNRPEWKDRIIIIGNRDAVSKRSAIIFM